MCQLWGDVVARVLRFQLAVSLSSNFVVYLEEGGEIGTAVRRSPCCKSGHHPGVEFA